MAIHKFIDLILCDQKRLITTWTLYNQKVCLLSNFHLKFCWNGCTNIVKHDKEISDQTSLNRRSHKLPHGGVTWRQEFPFCTQREVVRAIIPTRPLWYTWYYSLPSRDVETMSSYGRPPFFIQPKNKDFWPITQINYTFWWNLSHFSLVDLKVCVRAFPSALSKKMPFWHIKNQLYHFSTSFYNIPFIRCSILQFYTLK